VSPPPFSRATRSAAPSAARKPPSIRKAEALPLPCPRRRYFASGARRDLAREGRAAVSLAVKPSARSLQVRPADVQSIDQAVHQVLGASFSCCYQ
jgi:hypothetical protein